MLGILLLVSFSFAFLGVMLLYRRLDWKYGCISLAVGTVGSFYPITLIIPYLLIGWRLLQTRREVVTAAEQKAASSYLPLFIGKRHGSSPEEFDWIVAVELPPERKQQHTNYLVTKATSKVISGGGQNVTKSKAYLKDLKFHLYHVGWVSHKPNTSATTGDDLTNSEHSCKELAINHAIQISSSRAYTYIKSMALLRLNVMVYYAMMVFMGQIYEYYMHPISTILPLPWSIAMTINTIIAIEICLLQLGNLQDDDYAGDIENMKDVLQTCYEQLLAALVMINSYFTKPVHVQVKVDLTKKFEQTGTQVVETVIDRIGRSSIFGNDFGYIRRICWVETKDGTDVKKTFRPDYHGGLWQVDKEVFHKTKDTSTYPILLEKYSQIKSVFDIDWLFVNWVDLRMPLHCGLAAWLYMFTREEKIPLNIEEQADHWKRNYRPEAEVTTEDFVKNTVDLEKMKSDVAMNIALDLYIVLDSSGSIGSQSYEDAKKFLGDLVSGFTISKNNVQVGLVIYGSDAMLIFGLNTSHDKDELLSRIWSVEYLNSSTATGDAIRLMTTTGFTEQHGVRSSDGAIPRVAIVLTDGESDRGQDVPGAAQSARDKSIEMLAFGIGSGINEGELLEIAGSQDRVFRIDTFTNIDDVRAQITRGCRKYAFVKAAIDTTYNGEVSAKESRFFEFPITRDGITFQLEVTSGKLALYGSYSNPNPNPVWCDHQIQGIQRHEVKAFIPYSDVNVNIQRGSTRIFYCSLIGEKDSKFSITALSGTQ